MSYGVGSYISNEWLSKRYAGILCGHVKCVILASILQAFALRTVTICPELHICLPYASHACR